MSVLQSSTTGDVLLLYPGESLRSQIELWSARHPERRVSQSFERSLPEIRKLLRRAEAALVDATLNPARATDAFLQAVARLGSDAVAVYSDVSHEGLELFVRMRGSLMLMGPLFGSQWEDLFEQLLRSNRPEPAVPSIRRRAPPWITPDDVWQRREALLASFREVFGWPTSDPGGLN